MYKEHAQKRVYITILSPDTHTHTHTSIKDHLFLRNDNNLRRASSSILFAVIINGAG